MCPLRERITDDRASIKKRFSTVKVTFLLFKCRWRHCWHATRPINKECLSCQLDKYCNRPVNSSSFCCTFWCKHCSPKTHGSKLIISQTLCHFSGTPCISFIVCYHIMMSEVLCLTTWCVDRWLTHCSLFPAAAFIDVDGGLFDRHLWHFFAWAFNAWWPLALWPWKCYISHVPLV